MHFLQGHKFAPMIFLLECWAQALPSESPRSVAPNEGFFDSGALDAAPP